MLTRAKKHQLNENGWNMYGKSFLVDSYKNNEIKPIAFKDLEMGHISVLCQIIDEPGLYCILLYGGSNGYDYLYNLNKFKNINPHEIPNDLKKKFDKLVLIKQTELFDQTYMYR